MNFCCRYIGGLVVRWIGCPLIDCCSILSSLAGDNILGGGSLLKLFRLGSVPKTRGNSKMRGASQQIFWSASQLELVILFAVSYTCGKMSSSSHCAALCVLRYYNKGEASHHGRSFDGSTESLLGHTTKLMSLDCVFACGER